MSHRKKKKKSKLDFLAPEKRLKKIVGNINSWSILAERRQNCVGGRREGSSQSEVVLTVCGGYSLWYD